MPIRPELLLLRHGETEWNRQGRFQGAADSDLTSVGRVQAQAMGHLLKTLSVSALSHGARTSPQGRASATAQIALEPLGLTPRTDPRLVEIGMGDWTGLSRPEIDERWPGPQHESLFGFYARCPRGESLTEVAQRAQGVLDDQTGPLVIVTHGVTLRILCALALKRPLSFGGDLALRQGCVVRIAGDRLEILTPAAFALPADPTPDNTSPRGG
ncbi:histidine phosphatase family protein [Rubellimicrobium rubrum]|uniref:Histidine phosphatase family protein n=1 Tax=Rubellimicrobium rubrum TaxID=2585369 RepID=A0A5C4N0J4_9RHOB|nr:histidine phosphatase family protein [Rubellimicrobium rubrum]TNC50776.1 histidine phosphatase family protein [Rubellimicrobium rubrum]